MTFLSSLLTWANVPFVIVLGAALTFFLLQITGIAGLLMGGGDPDAAGDAGHDADAGADADHDTDTDTDTDHDAGAHPSSTLGKDLLAGIGVGTMPLSVVWQSFALCFGLAGVAVNSAYLDRTGALPTHSLAWSVPAALLFAFAVNHGLSRVFARLVVPPGKASTSRRDLVGRAGVVISSKVNAEFGEVRVVDASGDTLRLIVKTLDADDVIPEGKEVVFVEYDPEKDALFVAPLDADAPRPRPRSRSRIAPPAPDDPDPDEDGGAAREDRRADR